jgi:trehalose-phosphatase
MPKRVVLRDRRSALRHAEEIIARLTAGSPILFFDYDGTLAPITDVPSMAIISPAMRETIRLLSTLCPVIVVSGRDLNNVRQMVGLDNITYMGSHGFEASGPHSSFVEPWAERYAPYLAKAADELRFSIGGLRGALVEQKRFAVSLHYRLVDEQSVPQLKSLFSAVASRYPELRITAGKMVMELRPNVDWDKGAAVERLIREMDVIYPVPLYVGDDLTDEDAFNALRGRGITIFVGDREVHTAADYVLEDVDEVCRFLQLLGERMDRG